MKKNKHISDQYTILPFWAILFLILWLQAIPRTQSLMEITCYVLLTLISIYPITTHLSSKLLNTAMRKKSIKYFLIHFVLASVLVGLISFFYFWLFAYLELIGFFPKSSYFHVDAPFYYFIVYFLSGVTINASICGVRFFQENIKLQKVMLEQQLKTLEQQITPHFMFNVLNHINVLMQEDVALASEVLVKFSKILRYQLNYKENGQISLEKEVIFLRDFIDLERIRWGEELEISCVWKIEDSSKQFPSLLLITFIENAFKHVSRGTSDQAFVHVVLQQEGSLLSLQVENTITKLESKSTSFSGLGLKNIEKRLAILYGNDYSLETKRTSSIYYTKLVLKI